MYLPLGPNGHSILSCPADRSRQAVTARSPVSLRLKIAPASLPRNWAIVSSGKLVMLNRSGYVTRKGGCVPIGSCHNLATSPELTTTLLPAIYVSFTLSRAFQKGESLNLPLILAIELLFKYLALTTSCQSPFPISNFYHHLARREIFCLCRSLTPRPPFFLDRQTRAHFTR